MLKKILSVLGGLAAGGLVIGLVEEISHLIYPPPPGVGTGDPAALGIWVAALPFPAFLLVWVAHFAGSVVAGGVVKLINRKGEFIYSLIPGAMFLLFGIILVVLIPHPWWFTLIDLALYIPGSFIGFNLAKKWFKPKKRIKESALE